MACCAPRILTGDFPIFGHLTIRRQSTPAWLDNNLRMDDRDIHRHDNDDVALHAGLSINPYPIPDL